MEDNPDTNIEDPERAAVFREQRNRHFLQSNAFAQAQFCRERGLPPDTVHPAFRQANIRDVSNPLATMTGEAPSHTTTTPTLSPAKSARSLPPNEAREKPPRGRFFQYLRRMRPNFLARSRPPTPPPKDTPPSKKKSQNTLGQGAAVSSPPFMPLAAEAGITRSQSTREVKRPILKPKSSSRSFNERNESDLEWAQIRTRDRSFSDLTNMCTKTRKGTRIPPPIPSIPQAYDDKTAASERIPEKLRAPSLSGGKSTSSHSTSGSIPIAFHASRQSTAESMNSSKSPPLVKPAEVPRNDSSDCVDVEYEHGWSYEGDTDRIPVDSELFAIAPRRHEFEHRRNSRRAKDVAGSSEASDVTSRQPDQTPTHSLANKDVLLSTMNDLLDESFHSSTSSPSFYTPSSISPEVAQQFDQTARYPGHMISRLGESSVLADDNPPGMTTNSSTSSTQLEQGTDEFFENAHLREKLDWLQDSYSSMTAVVQEQDAALQRASYLLDLRVSAIELAQNEQFPQPPLCISRDGLQGNSLGSFHQSSSEIPPAIEVGPRLRLPRTDSLRNRMAGGIYEGQPPDFSRRRRSPVTAGNKGINRATVASPVLSPIQSRSTSGNNESGGQTPNNNSPLNCTSSPGSKIAFSAYCQTPARLYFDAEDEEQREAFEKFATAMAKWREEKAAAEASGRRFMKKCPTVSLGDTKADSQSSME